MKRWIWLLGAGLAVATPATAQLYMHSPREETATTQLAAALVDARNGHSEALDRHDANLEAGFKAGADALVAARLAARDLVLARYVNGDAAPLKAEIDVRLSSLGGAIVAPVRGPAPAVKPPSLNAIRRDILVLGQQRASASFVATAAAADTPRCDANGVFTSGAAVSTPVIENACDRVRTARETLALRVPCENVAITEWRLLLIAGPTDLCWKASAPSPNAPRVEADPRIETVAGLGGLGMDAVATLRVAIAEQEAAQAEVRKVGEQLSTALKNARNKPATGLTDDVRNSLCAFDHLVQGLQRIRLREPKVASTTVTGTTNKHCTASTIVNADAVVATIKAIAESATAFDADRAILASARATAEQFRSEQLGGLLTAVAGTSLAELQAAAKKPGGPAPSRGEILAVALVELASPIETLVGYGKGTLPDTDGVLVALAEAQMRQKLAEIEAGRLASLLALAEQGVMARAAEAGLLLEAQKALAACTAAGTALHTCKGAAVAYAASVSQGRVPGDVVEQQRNHVEYRVWAARERAAADATFAILSPAVDQLQVYGSGGITPEAVSGILNLIGLGAIARSN